MEITISGHVKGGALYLHNRKRIDAALKRWRDCDVVVTVTKAHATRSVAQNAFYWGCVVELISDHTGYTPDETHEALKQRFLPKKLAAAKKNGEIVAEFVIGGSTAKLNKLQFIDYLDAVIRWAAEELDVVIPDPDPEWRQKAQDETEAA